MTAKRSEIVSLVELGEKLKGRELENLYGEVAFAHAAVWSRVMAEAQARAREPAVPDRLLGVREAAKKLGVSPSSLYTYHGTFPFTTQGDDTKLLLSSRGIEEYI